MTNEAPSERKHCVGPTMPSVTTARACGTDCVRPSTRWPACGDHEPRRRMTAVLYNPMMDKVSGFTAGRLSWRYPAFTINPDWTAFRVSKIPSITFFFPPNNASGPPACRLLKGAS